MKVGDLVTLNEAGRAALLNSCGDSGPHAKGSKGYVEELTGEYVCFGCSREHYLEFKDSIGEIVGLFADVGPEWDVRWLPHNLRYAYREEYLKIVQAAE